MRRRSFIGATVASAVAAATRRAALAGPVTVDAIGDQVQTLPRGQYPEFAGPGIRELYRFAVEHGDQLRYMPCFCGCGRFGHLSNRECYIKSEQADGTITFTSHAAT